MIRQIELLLSRTGDAALRRRAYWIISQLDLKASRKILDAGCGDGFYLFLLSNLNPRVKLTGIDSDIKALQSARRNLKNKNVKLIYGDVTNLPFRESTFDALIASEVLEHVVNDSKVLYEFMRVLKPQGRVIVSVPNSNYPFFWDPINWLLERLFHVHISSGFFAGIWNQHLRLYSQSKLLNLFKRSNYAEVKLARLTHYCLPFNHYLINIAARMLANRKIKPNLKNKFSKFQITEKKEQNLLFRFLFVFDKLNNIWDGRGSAVSLVVTAVKR